MIRLGVDLGGTFTDLVLVDRKDIGQFIHGTTVATNALIERKGVATAA